MLSCFRYLASVQHIDIYLQRLRPTFLRGYLISKKAHFAMLKYLSSAVVAVFLAIMASGTTMAQTETSSISESSEPLQVAFGAYVLRISHVSPKEGSADVDMWVWFRWKNSDLRPDLTFEIANGVITSRSESDFYSVEDYKVASVRVQAEIFQDFDVNRYPLDNHTIHIKIEDAMMPNDGLVFTADEDSALDQGVNVAGWAVALQGVAVAPYVYQTDYGLLGSDTAGSHYSRIDMSITLDRQSYGPLFKSYWISGLAVILALMSLLLSATESSARFGMALGAIFAASANAINIYSQLPPTTAITLAEQVNLIAVGIIFTCVFVSLFSTRLMNTGRPSSSQRLDRVAMGIIGVVYIALNFVALSVDINAL